MREAEQIFVREDLVMFVFVTLLLVVMILCFTKVQLRNRVFDCDYNTSE